MPAIGSLSHRSCYPANPLSLDPHCSDKARLGHRRVIPETPKANRWRAVLSGTKPGIWYLWQERGSYSEARYLAGAVHTTASSTA